MVAISEEAKKSLLKFLAANPKAGLVPAYLFFLEKKFHLKPVLFQKGKMIFQGADEAVRKLESEGGLYHGAEVFIQFGQQSVNQSTKRIYICPFTGKVFGDNTHPNPQDAIYDWVSTCPENTERVGGLRVKRFYVSEDPELIKSYAEKEKPPGKIVKSVFSSRLNNRIFATKQAVIEDFKKHYLKPLTLVDVQSQNKYQIEESFLTFIQNHLSEDKLTNFFEALNSHEEFEDYINEWIGEEEA